MVTCIVYKTLVGVIVAIFIYVHKYIYMPVFSIVKLLNGFFFFTLFHLISFETFI